MYGFRVPHAAMWKACPNVTLVVQQDIKTLTLTLFSTAFPDIWTSNLIPLVHQLLTHSLVTHKIYLLFLQ